MSKRSAPEALGDTEAEEEKKIGIMDLAMDMVEQEIQEFRNSFEESVSKFRTKRQKFYDNIMYNISTVRDNPETGDTIYWSSVNIPTKEVLNAFSKLSGRVTTVQTLYSETSSSGIEFYVHIGQTLKEEKEKERKKKKLKIARLEQELAEIKESLLNDEKL